MTTGATAAPSAARARRLRRRRARRAAGLLAGLLATAPGSAGAVELAGAVTEVVDGDTLTIRARGVETTVRLVGIDTPETRHPSEPVQCFGRQASARAARLLPPGRRVRLVTDPGQDARDRYGRLLAYVYTAGRSGARGSVNFALVASGHARTYVHDGVRFAHAPAFLRAQHRARRAGRGLWGPPCNGRTRAASSPSGGHPGRSPGAAPPGCDRNYAGACVPISSRDLDCADVGAPVRVVGADPHRLHRDGDGRGCESR